MIKNAIKEKIIVSFLTLIILTIIYFIPTNKNFNKEIVYTSNYNYLYLLNNDLLVRVSSLSNTSNTLDKVKEIISYLTINSNNSKYINNKLKPIIPEGTYIIDMSLDNNLLKINFSKNILNIKEELSEKLIESIIYSLLEIDDIKSIMIFVEGSILNKLNNIYLPPTLDKSFGINKIYNLNNINNLSKYTLYYYTLINNEYSLVPVTMFNNDSDNKVEVIIKSLKSSNYYQSDLVSFLSNNTKLLDYEILENKIKLNFNNYLLDSFYNDKVKEEVMYAISTSFKDTFNINDIEIYIENKKL